MKKQKTKLTLGQRTLVAILKCETRGQYERFRKIGMGIVPNFGYLADKYVVDHVHYCDTGDTEPITQSSEMLGKAVDDTKFDPLWSVIYRIALRLRGA